MENKKEDCSGQDKLERDQYSESKKNAIKMALKNLSELNNTDILDFNYSQKDSFDYEDYTEINLRIKFNNKKFYKNILDGSEIKIL